MKHRAAHSGEHLMQVVKFLVELIWEMLMGKKKAGEIRLIFLIIFGSFF
nr:MAG TPA: hypothetical protein [Caudoviricetes sp.]